LDSGQARGSFARRRRGDLAEGMVRANRAADADGGERPSRATDAGDGTSEVGGSRVGAGTRESRSRRRWGERPGRVTDAGDGTGGSRGRCRRLDWWGAGESYVGEGTSAAGRPDARDDPGAAGRSRPQRERPTPPAKSTRGAADRLGTGKVSPAECDLRHTPGRRLTVV
jgi:hypothetical protein